MTRTQDAMQKAKDALLYALRTAEDEKLPASICKQIESLTGRAETLQWKLKLRAGK